ncbi:hypothetical protein K491DRAFT_778238 [Lophiostoma macrostomum CBS 122681]|uniref:Uncharacterized protein n=1 Tax=Lophiostoma macrostomum CBS 122681 TaxID=1314788 RepID=A0A6A6TA42_9PLEO|nr:hypothetical protein K491DRAFT_778238 [Lophiostoma macrostomum CBS 122681]
MSNIMAYRVLIAPIDIVITMVVCAVAGAHAAMFLLDNITVQGLLRYVLVLVMLALAFFIYFSACLEVHHKFVLRRMVDFEDGYIDYYSDEEWEGDVKELLM